MAVQKQTATSISTSPSMSLQHGFPTGVTNPPTGRTGMPSTLAQTTLSFSAFFGQAAGAGGGSRNGILAALLPCNMMNKDMLKNTKTCEMRFELYIFCSCQK